MSGYLVYQGIIKTKLIRKKESLFLFNNNEYNNCSD